MKKMFENRWAKIIALVIFGVLLIKGVGWLRYNQGDPVYNFAGLLIFLAYLGFLGYLFWPSGEDTRERIEAFKKFLKD